MLRGSAEHALHAGSIPTRNHTGLASLHRTEQGADPQSLLHLVGILPPTKRHDPRATGPCSVPLLLPSPAILGALARPPPSLSHAPSIELSPTHPSFAVCWTVPPPLQMSPAQSGLPWWVFIAAASGSQREADGALREVASGRSYSEEAAQRSEAPSRQTPPLSHPAPQLRRNQVGMGWWFP